MIERVQIESFRALRGVDVRLKPLTVLIGPNDTGKSSFLDAVHRFDDQDLGFERTDWWRRHSRPRVQLAPEPTGNRRSGGIALFRLPAGGVAMESAGLVDSPQPPALDLEGSRLAGVLDYFLRRDRRRFDAVVGSLASLLPGFEDLRIETPKAEVRRITALIDGGFEIEGARLSTGVRLCFFFVVLAHHPTPPEVVLLEEPESGVHPGRLGEIMKLLRGLTTGALGAPPVQVILTTHSPYLLDQVRLRPTESPQDQVLIFRREADGSRSVTEADAERLALFLDEFMLGEVWFNQGEEGLVPKLS